MTDIEMYAWRPNLPTRYQVRTWYLFYLPAFGIRSHLLVARCQESESEDWMASKNFLAVSV